MNFRSAFRAACAAATSFAPVATPAIAADAPPSQIPAAIRRTLKDPAPGGRKSEPVVMPSAEDALTALQRMKLPDGLEARLWAAEPMLANPVAFNIDERGRIFVTETYRYRSSALDIRNYLWMLEEDLASRTVEDRTAMLLKNFGPEGIKELSVESEIVRLLEDTDGDGVGDRSSIYADGFNTPLDGIASGIVARRGEVWFTNIPSIWRLKGERRAETRTEVSRGYGVHFSLTGHDLHGPTFGPDGKIYFSFGDRGASVKTQEGKLLHHPDMGAVYRMNPDGSQMELFADGLRNPQSLLFTENGDLFTADNDSDKGDEERLVHIAEGGDSGWRIGYQHAPLTAVERIGPWSAEKLWMPRHDGQPAYILPPICNIEDGPSGVAYYPGTGLNASFAGAIFVTHFKGGVARSGIYSYNVNPKGASYQIADAKPFLTASLPTDVRYGPDGRVYISDWTDGYDMPKRGRIYAIFDPKHVNDPIVKETQKLIGGDWTKRSSEELATLLGHADWRVRLEAQYTLAERGAASQLILARVATAPAPAAREVGNPANLPAYARRHAIWGLGQLAVKDPAALAPLRSLVRDADPEVRAQAIKLFGEHRQVDQVDALIAALKDENARVKFFAAQSLGKVSAAKSEIATRTTPALLEALRANNDADAFVRHALVMGLVGGKNLPALLAASTANSRAVRLGVLLAFRRLGRAEIARFLRDADPYLVREAALAINDAPIDEAMPALAALLERDDNDEATLYRAINANFRLGQAAHAGVLAKFAARSRVSTKFTADTAENLSAKFRAEALNQLGLWPAPPARDRVLGIYRPVVAQVRGTSTVRDAKPARDALAPVLGSLLDPTAPAAVQTAALNAIDTLHIASAADAIYAVLRDESQTETNRISALSALDKIKDARLADAVKIASVAQSTRLRLAALPIASRLAPEAAVPVLANFLAKGTPEEKKAAFETLGTLQHPSADALIAEQLKALATGGVAPAAQLELLEAAAQREHADVKKLLTARDVALTGGNDPLAAFRYALQGGDRERGRVVFETQPALACVRCHRIGAGPGGDAGPNLADVGTKYQREELLESIIKPNAKIAPGFDTIVLTRKSGGVAVGIVASENDDAITLRNSDNKLIEVKKSDIAKREGAPSSMPEIYAAILTKSELRDMVEYLASIRTPAGRGGRGGAPGGRGGAPAAVPPPRALRDLPAPAAAISPK